MKYELIKHEGKQYCNVLIDKSSSCGILRFTHEIYVTLVLEDNEWVFNGAWHIGVSEMSWEKEDKEDFDLSFPGLFDEIIKGLNNLEGE